MRNRLTATRNQAPGAHDLMQRYGDKIDVDHPNFTIAPGTVTVCLSNEAIAARLVVTEREVEAYVTHIVAKLDLPESPDAHREVLALLTSCMRDSRQRPCGEFACFDLKPGQDIPKAVAPLLRHALLSVSGS